YAELPAVVHATQAALFVTREEQRGAAVWAVVLEQPDLALRVAEGDQLFAEQQDTHRVAVGSWQLAREHGWHPVLAHQRAHRRPRSDAGNQLIIFLAEHGGSLRPLSCQTADSLDER